MRGQTPERQTRYHRRQYVERERALAALATRQHGVVARRQLVELGLGAGAIDARLRTARLSPIHRGVYSFGHRRMNMRSYWLAAVLACGDGALLSHRSAAALWGLVRPRSSPVDVISSHGRRGRSGIALHEGAVLACDRTAKAEIPVTTVPRTLLDLAEVVDEDALRRAFEEADRLKLLQMSAVAQVCERAGRRKGLVALRRLVANAGAPASGRTPLEHGFTEFCHRHLNDLPTPLSNVVILEKEVDAYWPQQRLVVEMDSWEFHSHRAAFERDRSRDAAMQAAGYRVIRLTHRRLHNEASAVAAQLRAMLAAPPHTR